MLCHAQLPVDQQPHGVKRRNPDDLEADPQRLTKRFNLLNIDAHSRSSNPANAPRSHDHNDEEWMDVEDTKHRVFIHDLDKELEEEVESDSERPIFIPDIEKHLNRLPKHVLVGDDAKAAAKMQMVLYRLSPSLTVPEEYDSARKAILEARARARDRQALTIPGPPAGMPTARFPNKAHGHSLQHGGPWGQDQDPDPDAMDMD
ncbi:hypothetical protein EJ06DRAFT_14624 [Trichodelitschia bisporula]|uniref:Uncharacterized protein n=1 Tax=Trichodelitschia bisporula TaxID=703511 RepID=A0A6G1IA29_9PEZI|nr:hypothetical protein EJ06DRAFT_14624 [Trichodelitschia bisporula]